MIVKALEKREEEKAWSLYSSVYPNFTEETFLSFDQFFNPPKPDHKSEDEILIEVKNILDSVRR